MLRNPISTRQCLTLLIFLLLTSACPIIDACSCVTLNTRCDTAWNSGELVFLGKVVSKLGGMERLGNGTMRLTDYEVHFAPVEVFRGESKSGKEVVLYTGFGGGDCGYPFVVGTSYLVYAYTYGGRLRAATCSETAPEVMVGGALRELRAIQTGRRADDLFGTVGIRQVGSGWADAVETQPLAKIPVHAIGNRGGRFSTTTDEQGAYAFPSLPSGKYRIEEDLPAGLTLVHNPINEPFSAYVKHTKKMAAGCRVDTFPNANGEISGRVVDQNGNGLAGYVLLQFAGPTKAGPAELRLGFTDDGAFSLKQLPPGRYRLVFQPKFGRRDNRRLKISWPAGSANSNPEEIDLGLGQHIENARFEISQIEAGR